MMAVVVARNPFEIMRDLASPLSPIERTVLGYIERAAAQGVILDENSVIAEDLGVQSTSSVSDVLRRLENKGIISRKLYQRGRQVCITATGECTAEPSNLTPHWRFRADSVPAPSVSEIKQRMPKTATTMEAEARLLGKSLNEFLCDLVYCGWHDYQARKDDE